MDRNNNNNNNNHGHGSEKGGTEDSPLKESRNNITLSSTTVPSPPPPPSLFGLTEVANEEEEEGGGSGSGSSSSSSSSSSGNGEESNWREQLDVLRAEYADQIKIQLQNHDIILKKEKEKRMNAEGQWNSIEYDLRVEREEHLRTCIQLKECRSQLTKLDRETTERIGELTSEYQDMKEIIEKQQKNNLNENTMENSLRNELAKSGGVIEQVRARYRQKMDSLETFYGEKIVWLTSKVELLELEKKKNTGSRKIRGDDDEYDRPSSSDLLQPEEDDDDDDDDAYYGGPQLRRRGRTMQRRGGGRDVSRSTSKTRKNRLYEQKSHRQSLQKSRSKPQGGPGRRRKKETAQYNGSLNSFGSSMKRSKSTQPNRRNNRQSLNISGSSNSRKMNKHGKRRTKSGPGVPTMSASERRKQYNMQQRYPTKKRTARGGGAGAVKMLRGRDRSREPLKRRGAWG